MAREASGCSNSARDACVAVALGRAHEEPAPSHGSPLTTSHAPCGRGQNPAPQSPRRCPAPQILLPCFRRSLWLQKSHADARKPHFLSRSSRVTARSAGDADTKRQSAGLCAGWHRGGGQHPPVRGPRALLASRLGTLMFTMCHKVHVTGVCCLLFTVAGSGHSRAQCGVRCGHAQCAFRTRLCAARGRTRPCTALSPVHARQAPGGGRSLRQGQAPGRARAANRTSSGWETNRMEPSAVFQGRNHRVWFMNSQPHSGRVRAFGGRELALPWEQGTPPQPTQPRHPPRLPRGGPVGPAAGAGPVRPPTPTPALRGPARRGALRPPPLPCAPLLSPASFEATLQSF